VFVVFGSAFVALFEVLNVTAKDGIHFQIGVDCLALIFFLANQDTIWHHI